MDDQTLFVESPNGLVVIPGCAHSGIVNTLEYVAELTGQNGMRAIIGGMHLVRASQMRIERTIEAFRKFGVERIVPLHCTGQTAVESFQEVFGDQCLSLGAGGKVSFC
jgi:7,8-dihydropterin-6-yl-methyl-4-(beta-D-ribofuranosyl)aminobenzene 5'-phosphate synthase